MKTSNGKCRIDSVVVLEAKIDLLEPGPSPLHAFYALTDSKSGGRYGKGTRNMHWSEKTMMAMEQLLAAMEEDILVTVFDGESTAAGVDPPSAPPSDRTPGL